MKLRRLTISQLPGITSGFSLDDIADGINIVTGPNAVGKSSLVRALRHLIDRGQTGDDGALTLEAEFDAPAGRYSVRRSGSLIEWQLDGSRTEAPSLPGGDFLSCYWLGMRDLLDAGSTEKQIAARLRQSLYGGFDLDVVREQLARPRARGEVGPRHGQAQARTVQDCRRRLRDVDSEYAALETRRQQLSGLDREVREAEVARVRADRARHALEWLHARRALAIAQAGVDAFPQGMDLLTGREAEELDALLTRRAQAASEEAAATEAGALAEQQIRATGLAETNPDLSVLTAAREDLTGARAHAQEVARLRRELDDAEGVLADIGARLNAGGGDTRQSVGKHAIRLDGAAVDRAVEIAEKLRDTRDQIAKLEALTTAEPVAEDTLAQYESLLAELRRWLRQATLSRQRGIVAGAASALVGGLVAVVLAVMVLVEGVTGLHQAWPVALLLSAAVASAGGVIAIAGLRQLRNELAGTMQRITEHAGALQLAVPSEPTPEVLQAWLNECERQLVTLRLEAEQAREALQNAEKLKPLNDEKALYERLHGELAQRLGFTPLQTAEGTARFLQQALEYDRAQQRCAGLTAQLASAREALTGVIARVSAVLAGYSLPVPGDEAGRESADEPAQALPLLQARIDELMTRTQRLAEARRDLATASQQHQRASFHVKQVDQEIARLLEKAGLSDADQRALRDRCERYADYRAALSECEQARIVERERQALVGNDAELIASVQRDDEAGLNTIIAELVAQAERLEAHRNEAAEIRARLQVAGEDQRLEQARLAHHRALETLSDAFDDALLADAGQFLIDDVAAEHRAEREPAILASARNRFALFTNHRYRLEIDSDGTLRARDNESGVLHEMAELSTGTHMQLLIAVRLAWSGAMEQGAETLPVFLDEALTTTDPERFASMVQAFQQMVDEEQRQVFYLSAQPLDVMRWEKAGGRPAHHIDLPRVRFGTASASATDFELPQVSSVPAPDAMSAQAYARILRVPPLQPVMGASAIHAFYLLRDHLPLLHRLISDWHVTHVGPLRELLMSDAAAAAVGDARMREQVLGRIRSAEVWTELWHIGRGRPVDRNTLEHSGAVTATFIDEVTTLAEQCGGDARALLQCLHAGDVKRFQKAKAEELEAWLADQGYLSDETPLTTDERLRNTLLRAGATSSVADIREVVASLEAAYLQSARH
jgi:DNA repair protein SbcC/Rad50